MNRKKSRFQIPYMDVINIIIERSAFIRFFHFNPHNLAFDGEVSNCAKRINPLSFGEVALRLNVIMKMKKAVTGRREIAVYFAQLLVLQLTQEGM